jgi:formamidopyrimidine-DNA glycosylase
VFVLHFGMTGYLAIGEGEAPADRHVRLVVEFADDHWLALVDQRRLGRVALADGVQDYVVGERLGPDAMSLSARELRDVVRGRPERLLVSDLPARMSLFPWTRRTESW